MTSRLGQKTVGVAAIVVIILLIILIVLLWTGFGAGVFSSRNTDLNPSHRGYEHRTHNSISRRTQTDVITTMLSGFTTAEDGMEVVTSTATLLNEKIDDYIRSTDRSKGGKTRVTSSDDSTQNHQKPKPEVEYVKPVKISPPPLHEHDLLYGGDQWAFTPVLTHNTHRHEAGQADRPPFRHHSGHFRHKMALLWDPHPQYEFTVFGRHFHLLLAHDSSFVHPELQVTHVWHNMTMREHPGFRPNGCFYTGSVRGDPHSTVAVSLCHGMTGHIRTSTGSYFIKPAENWKNHTSPILHAVYRIPSLLPGESEGGEGIHQCGVVDDADYMPPASMILNRTHPVEQYVGNDEHSHRKRTKRSLDEDYNFNRRYGSRPLRRVTSSTTQEYFIEIMVVADKKMAEYHGEGLYHYVLTLMSIVSHIYKDATVGNAVTVAVVKVLILKEMEFVMRDNRRRNADHDGISAPEMLRKFCEWQSSVNTLDDSSPHHHDTALLLTREDICRNPEKKNCDTLGLAELGKICDKSSSCAIVQDNGLSAAFTIAHELGHVLNMPHDDDQKCLRFRRGSTMHNVMSRMLDVNTYPWAWSNCSRHVLTEFLDAGNGQCLLDEPYQDLITSEHEQEHGLPGESFTEDRQCELVFGETSKICSYMPVCKLLWCTTNLGEQAGCRTQYMPWADGTPCDTGRWCQRGECVVKTVLEKVDGNWGAWQPYGECSRTCGGGVRKSIRHCNRPVPSNGGRYCTGRRERYRSCSTRDCPPNSKGYREEQCAVHNNNNFNIHGLPQNVKWVPKYGMFSPKEQCRLYCRVAGTSAYYPLREKVVDGTPCGPDTYDICVNGICKAAGCDHNLSSTKQLDMCGKCGGDNSTCVPIKGHYNNSTYGYSQVVQIPAGSSNLDIRQYSHEGNADDNFLALKDGDSGDYILNGGYIVSTFRKLLLLGEATLEYSGSQSVVERLNSSSRPLKRDLILEVLSVGRLDPPNITYQYTVQRGIQYQWMMKWSPCNKVCNGERWQLQMCVREDNSQTVPDEHCASLQQLPKYTESCNTHCILKWKTWPVTECSTHCGPGKQTMGLQCVQQFHDTGMNDNAVQNISCAHIHKPSEVVDCEGPCNSTHWEFGVWSECSRTCGGGIQTRSAHCVEERGMPVEDLDCKQSEPPVVERPCGMQDCPQWVLGELSPCSVTCGIGERQHTLWCQMGNRIVNKIYCESQPVPQYKEVCTREPCASWQYGPWQACSVTCGKGVSIRTVVCRSLQGNEVDESSCSTEEKAVSSQACFKQPCHHEMPASLFPSTSTTTSMSLPLDDNHNFGPYSPNHRHINILPTAKPRTIFDDNEDEDIQTNTVPIEPRVYGPPHMRGVWKTSDWGPCSVTCGDGFRQRTAVCMDANSGTPIDKVHCAKANQGVTEEFCRKPTCATWRVGDWKSCSVTCGKGIKTREVICINSVKNEVVLNDYACTNHNLAQPEREKECYAGDCPIESSLEYPSHQGADDQGKESGKSSYKWRTGPWGECSKSCGIGYMRRMVACPTEDGKEGKECDIAEKPIDRISCNLDPCPVWSFGTWSECNKSCGEGGYQHRKVWCQSHTGQALADTSCSTLERPNTQLKCELRECDINYSDLDIKPVVKEHQWRTEEWSQCSKTCGRGERSRKVVCVEVPTTMYPTQRRQYWQSSDPRHIRHYEEWRLVERPSIAKLQHKYVRPKLLNGNDVIVNPVKCGHLKMPKSFRGCRRTQCPFTWVEGEWSECSQTCGHGIQHRSIHCQHFGSVVSPKQCNPDEYPSEQRDCFVSNCQDEFHWVPGEWQPCSHACGRKGRQQRHLYCYHRDRKKVTRNNCSRIPKPHRKRKCNQEKCSFTTCLDVQQKLQAKEDKEYMLHVMGINVLIYCHGMSTDNPQEYISLPAGEDENFSEIYDRRLVNPDTCPYNGQRRENCRCVIDAKGKARLTVYSKVRLNITSLRVITQDNTFSRQVKGQRVSYGEAGDCYSKANCPQGRFSINLKETKFFVSHLTKWEGHGSNPSKKIQRSERDQKVSGKCGGYCGTCSPHLRYGLKLDVLPP